MKVARHVQSTQNRKLVTFLQYANPILVEGIKQGGYIPWKTWKTWKYWKRGWFGENDLEKLENNIVFILSFFESLENICLLVNFSFSLCQLHLTSITDDSKYLLIKTVVFWNRYATFQDQAWILDYWSINILVSSCQFIGKVWHVCENKALNFCHHLHPLLMEVSIQILFSSNNSKDVRKKTLDRLSWINYG